MNKRERQPRRAVDLQRAPRGQIPPLDQDELARSLATLGVVLDTAQRAALDQYWGELATWSQRLNLVSSGDLPRLATRHIVDAFAVVPSIRERLAARPDPAAGDCVLDLGSGGGLPGIPVAIALRTRPVLLVERERRRANFLRACARVLASVPLRVIPEDAEKIELLPHQRPIAIVTRAAFPLADLLRISEQLLHPGGWLLAHRSPDDDADRARTAALHFESRLPYELPGESRRREIQIWRRSFT